MQKECKNFMQESTKFLVFHVLRSHIMKSRFMQIYVLCIYAQNPKSNNEFGIIKQCENYIILYYINNYIFIRYLNIID